MKTTRSTGSENYSHEKIEKKWQKSWDKSKIYKVTDEAAGKPKAYILDMFPYPSGAGLHVGHPKGYIATDVYSRFKRMNGYNILHPMGWDAFGLPAEEYAIKNKIHPNIAVKKNIETYKQQLSILGFNYDWSREVNTTDPDFYKWTQWTFIQMFKKGLVVESNEPINWCPSCKTGLANEDLDNGRCERCGSIIEKKPMRQWVIKITKYADRMLEDLDALNWPESIKESQRNWIGKSEGAEIDFKLVQNGKSTDDAIKIFTTRADTLYGVTYLVLSPEHPYLHSQKNNLKNWLDIEKYIKEAEQKTTIERGAEDKQKTGIVIQGLEAINPINNEKIPVWVADYVLPGYGTGAVMAVPAHDDRDFMFAQKYDLPIKSVIEPVTGEKRPNEEFRTSIVALVYNPKTKKYLTINWGKESGGVLLVGGGRKENEDPVECARREVGEETGYSHLKHMGTSELIHHHYIAHSKGGVSRYIQAIGVHFELSDEHQDEQKLEKDEEGKFTIEWRDAETIEKEITDPLHRCVFNRFTKNIAYIGHGMLTDSGEWSGKDSLSSISPMVKKVGGKFVTRYKLRDWVFSRQRYWGEPIPLIHCPDCGVVPVPEKDLPLKLPNVKYYEPTGTGESPLAAIDSWVNVKCPNCKKPAKRETNTMPQWAGSSWYYLRYIDPKNKKQLVDPKKEKYWQPVDMYVGGAEHATRHLIYARFWHKFLFDIGVVSTSEPFSQLKNVGLIIASDGRKMSKRFGNVINPNDIVKTFGADTLRVYEMFMGPFDQTVAWSTDNMIGSRRFIERFWRLFDKIDFESGTGTGSESEIKELERLGHKTIKKVGEDIETFGFNTAISSMMIFLNALEKQKTISPKIYCAFLLILAPFAPYITEEILAKFVVAVKKSKIGKSKHEIPDPVMKAKSIHLLGWPSYDAKMIVDEMVTVMIQINGKVRGSIVVSAEDAKDENTVKNIALQNEEIGKRTGDNLPDRIIFVPGKLINLVFKGL